MTEEWSRPIKKILRIEEILLDIYLLSLYLKPIEKEPGQFFIKQFLGKERRKEDEKVSDFGDFGFYL